MSSSPQKKRKAYPSVVQKARLVSILEADPELRGGKFSASFSLKEATARWTRIAEDLNSIPGGKKTWKEWRKTWQDMKTKVKRKDVEVRRSANRTGGGSPLPPLSTVEEQVLHTISESARVGHSDSQESLVVFDDCTTGTEPSQLVTVEIEKMELPWDATEVTVAKEGEGSTAATPCPAPSQIIEIVEVEQSSPPRQCHLPKKRRLQKSLDAAEALTKALNEKNKIKKEYNKEFLLEMHKQTDALSRQADALSRQADALAHIASCPGCPCQ